MNETTKDEISEETGKMAASLAVVEIGLGSLLHAFKIPLSGHALSINQMAMLSRSTFHLKSKKAALEISLVASLLKSLSPAGKKLTPMLAITAQGILFYFGITLAGFNILGLLLAIILASSWAFIQPVLFIFLLFGQTSVQVAEYFLNETKKIFPHADTLIVKILIGFFLLKCVLAIAACLWAIKAKEESFLKFNKKMLDEIKIKPAPKKHSPAVQALKDLLNPVFIFSFLLTLIYFIFSEASSARIIWELLRPIAVGYIIFYFFRIYPLEKISLQLEARGWKNLAKSLNHALEALRSIKFLK